MCKKIWTIAKLNLKNIKVPYFVTSLIFAIIFIQAVIYAIIASVTRNAGDQLNISSGNYIWLLVMLAAIFIPIKNFRRIVNLGGKRETFFWGSLANYAILAGAVSLFNTLFYYVFESFLISKGNHVGFEAYMRDTSLMDNHYVTVNLIELFGWSGHGVFFAIIQQFAFLFLLAVVIHTITAAQDKWYGWVTDLVIATILGVFIPIAPLRSILITFFYLIIFNTNAFMQILICLLLAVAIYMLNKPIFARKSI
jgi:hypothetical protein